MIRPRVSVLAFLVACLIAALSAGPVSATTMFQEHYSGTDSFSYDCGGGVTVDVEVTFSGVAHIRVGTGKDDTAFFGHDNFEYREVHTASTGEVLILSGNGLFQETKATAVDVPGFDNAFMFTAVVAGQPFMVTDADGNVLIRDRGAIRETILFDTEGDDVPGGIFIEQVDFQVGGPHPGLDFDTCNFFAP